MTGQQSKRYELDNVTLENEVVAGKVLVLVYPHGLRAVMMQVTKITPTRAYVNALRGEIRGEIEGYRNDNRYIALSALWKHEKSGTLAVFATHDAANTAYAAMENYFRGARARIGALEHQLDMLYAITSKETRALVAQIASKAEDGAK